MSSGDSEREAGLAFIESSFETSLNRLNELVRIPSVSSWKETHHSHMKNCADAIINQLKSIGLTNVKLLELQDKSIPACVFAEWRDAPGQPTVLLYAHYDVQPPGDDALWKTPAWEPTVVDCPDRGGKRLFARGSADDKAGILVHIAAIEAALKTTGKLPINIKILFEGEEEIGSHHLGEYLNQYIDVLKSDIIILTDTTNYEIGTPSLTYSLRGLFSLDVELRTVDHTLHSGMFGGVLMDPLAALCKLLGTLHDDKGRVAVEGFNDDVRAPSEKELQNIKELNYTEEKLRHEAGLLPGVAVIGDPNTHLLERIWLRPAINVIALNACTLELAANKILPFAKARISCRIVAHQKPDKVAQAVMAHLKKHCPYGAEIKLKQNGGTFPWVCIPEGKVFEAAERAMFKGYGRKLALIGCGGSIGFVEPFAKAFGGAPALLIGVEDPFTNAHGENESLCISDFKKAILSVFHLFHELKV